MSYDKELVKRRFEQNLHSYNSLATVQRDIAHRLAQMTLHHKSHVLLGVEIGAGTGFLTEQLLTNYPDSHWTVNDLTATCQRFLPSSPRITFRACDGETMPFDGLFDMIATASVVQWFDNLELFIARVSKALRSGGILALSTFGHDNFAEITATTGQSLEYHSQAEITQWCTDHGLRILEQQQWHCQQQFDTPIDVLRHIKATGVNAITKQRWTHADMARFQSDYRAYCNPITLTFHPIIVIACKQ